MHAICMGHDCTDFFYIVLPLNPQASPKITHTYIYIYIYNTKKPVTGLIKSEGEQHYYDKSRPEPNMLFILPILFYFAILKNLPYYSPQRTNYSLSKTYYSH